MLTRARLRDAISARTGYRKDIVAHVLDVFEDVVRDELLQQGEVALRGLFRIVPVQRAYRRVVRKAGRGLLDPPLEHAPLRRIILTIRPVRAFRKQLTDVLPPG